MDVLKDVKNAEAEAQRIEADYRQRAEGLAARSRADLERRRSERLAAVDAELQRFRDDLNRDLAVEKGRAHDAGATDMERLERSAAARRDAAVAVLLEKLNQR